VIESIPDDWRKALGDRLEAVDVESIDRVLAAAKAGQAYPPFDAVFKAFEATAFDSVRAVILGQDPYYTAGQACGLAFSVARVLPSGVKRPHSLNCILAELRRDQPVIVPKYATLERWAYNGVLLLNTALTVRPGVPGSHSHEWAPFMRIVLERLAERSKPIAFLLWGEHANSKREIVDRKPHIIISSAHPSSRRRSLAAKHSGQPPPFKGSRPFRKANAMLCALLGPDAEIDWNLD
jgi:uracil-DNA glycosylase